MGPEKRESTRKSPQFDPNQSWIDKTTGQHTIVVLGAIVLLVITIFLFCLAFKYESYAGQIIAALISTAVGCLGLIGGVKIGNSKK